MKIKNQIQGSHFESKKIAEKIIGDFSKESDMMKDIASDFFDSIKLWNTGSIHIRNTMPISIDHGIQTHLEQIQESLLGSRKMAEQTIRNVSKEIDSMKNIASDFSNSIK